MKRLSGASFTAATPGSPPAARSQYPNKGLAGIELDPFVVCIIVHRIDDFKAINDTYGHAEGDRALLIVADALREVLRRRSTPIFLARYGGDEFILIVHPASGGEIAPLVGEIREQIQAACRSCGAPYVLSISAGYSALSGSGDTFPLCQQRADESLYLDKARQKAHR